MLWLETCLAWTWLTSHKRVGGLGWGLLRHSFQKQTKDNLWHQVTQDFRSWMALHSQSHFQAGSLKGGWVAERGRQHRNEETDEGEPCAKQQSCSSLITAQPDEPRVTPLQSARGEPLLSGSSPARSLTPAPLSLLLHPVMSLLLIAVLSSLLVRDAEATWGTGVKYAVNCPDRCSAELCGGTQRCARTVLDDCGCCQVCAAGRGEHCYRTVSGMHGVKCGPGLFCEFYKDEDDYGDEYGICRGTLTLNSLLHVTAVSAWGIWNGVMLCCTRIPPCFQS